MTGQHKSLHGNHMNIRNYVHISKAFIFVFILSNAKPAKNTCIPRVELKYRKYTYFSSFEIKI